MRAIVQRVSQAAVTVEGETVGRIERGLLIYLGVAAGDGPADAAALADKIAHLRLFADVAGKMNLDLAQVGGAALVISNFTLLADCRQGRRPGFDAAADPQIANELYEQFAAALANFVPVEKGRFRATMAVSSVNDGPVNLLLDSTKAF